MDEGADKKIPQMPLNISAQIVCPSPKVWDFDEKRLHWASVVRGYTGYSFGTNREKLETKTENEKNKNKKVNIKTIMKLKKARM